MKRGRFKPNVVNGGIAVPLGNNFYLMKGRTHANGGIDIGPNNKTGIEVENNEVLKVDKSGVKVYSAQPILNGDSPANKILKGDNPTKIFKAQENYKDRFNLNDDGTRKKELGGKSNKILNLDNVKATGTRAYNKDNINYIYNRLLDSNKFSNDQVLAIIANIIDESGGEPLKYDESGDFYGLLQWSKTRYRDTTKDYKKALDSQINHIIETASNSDTTKDWHHGGDGSGYGEAIDAYKAFKSGAKGEIPMHSFTYGYVRPRDKHNAYKNRLNIYNQLQDASNEYETQYSIANEILGDENKARILTNARAEIKALGGKCKISKNYKNRFDNK